MTELYSAKIDNRFRALESRIAALERRLEAAQAPTGRPAVDGIGAPLLPAGWPALREAVKATIAEIGLEAAAALYGATPETFRDVVYRQRPPGPGTRARLAVLAGGRGSEPAPLLRLPDRSGR